MLKSGQNCNKYTFLDKLRAITQDRNIKTRQMTYVFHLLFPLCLWLSFLYFKIAKTNFYVVLLFDPLWSVKFRSFLQKLPIFRTHDTFIESKHPEVAKNPEESQRRAKKRCQLTDYVLWLSNPWNITFKGTTELYFMHCLHVIIILFSTGLYKSVFSTTLDT